MGAEDGDRRRPGCALIRALLVKLQHVRLLPNLIRTQFVNVFYHSCDWIQIDYEDDEVGGVRLPCSTHPLELNVMKL